MATALRLDLTPPTPEPTAKAAPTANPGKGSPEAKVVENILASLTVDATVTLTTAKAPPALPPEAKRQVVSAPNTTPQQGAPNLRVAEPTVSTPTPSAQPEETAKDLRNVVAMRKMYDQQQQLQKQVEALEKKIAAQADVVKTGPIPTMELSEMITSLQKVNIPLQNIQTLAAMLDGINDKKRAVADEVIANKGDISSNPLWQELNAKVKALETIVNKVQSPNAQEQFNQARDYVQLTTEKNSVDKQLKNLGKTIQSSQLDEVKNENRDIIAEQLNEPLGALVQKFDGKRIGGAELNKFIQDQVEPRIQKGGIKGTAAEISILRIVTEYIAEHNRQIPAPAAVNTPSATAAPTPLEGQVNKTSTTEQIAELLVDPMAAFLDKFDGQRISNDNLNQFISTVVRPLIARSALGGTSQETALLRIVTEEVVEHNKTIPQAPATAAVNAPQAPSSSAPTLNKSINSTENDLQANLAALSASGDGLTAPNLTPVSIPSQPTESTSDVPPAKSKLDRLGAWASAMKSNILDRFSKKNPAAIEAPEVPEPSMIIDSFLNTHPELTPEDRQAIKITVARELGKGVSINPKTLTDQLAQALKTQQRVADERADRSSAPFAAIDRQIREAQVGTLGKLATAVSKGLGEEEKVALTETLQEAQLKKELFDIVSSYTQQRDDDIAASTQEEILAKVKTLLEKNGKAGRYDSIAQEVKMIVARHNIDAVAQRSAQDIEETLSEKLAASSKSSTYIDSTIELPKLMEQVKAIANIRPSTVAYMESRLGRLIASHNLTIATEKRVSAEKILDRVVASEKATTAVIDELNKQPLENTLQTVVGVLAREQQNIVARELTEYGVQLESLFTRAKQQNDTIDVTTVEPVINEIGNTLSMYSRLPALVRDRILARVKAYNSTVTIEDTTPAVNAAAPSNDAPVTGPSQPAEIVNNNPRPTTDAILEAHPENMLARTVDWLKATGNESDAQAISGIDQQIDQLLMTGERNQDTIFPDNSDALLNSIESIVGKHNKVLAQKISSKMAKRFYDHNQRVKQELHDDGDEDGVLQPMSRVEVKTENSVNTTTDSIPETAEDAQQKVENTAIRILRDEPATADNFAKLAKLFEGTNYGYNGRRLANIASILSEAANSSIPEERFISATDTVDIFEDIQKMVGISDILRQQMKKRATTIIDQQNRKAAVNS